MFSLSPKSVAPYTCGMSSVLTASVVVPAYNAASTIDACLSALTNQLIPDNITFNVVLVNDASTDQTAALSANYANVKVVNQPVNQGRSAARNAGAQAADGEILLFTDADCEPTPTWVHEMLKPFSADSSTIGVKGAYYCKQTEPVARFTQLELEDKYDEMAQHETISFIDTYAAGYRRSAFLEHGGFDQTLTYSLLEDQDFSFRLAAAGCKMVFAPRARVYHRHVTEAGRYYWRKWTIGKWKTVILRRFPERRGNDSRTPMTLKLQFGLALLMTPLLPLLLFRPMRQLLILLLTTFTATSFPFISKLLQRDPALLPFALPMLLVRAFGLAHGYLDGLIRLRNVR